MLQRQSRPTEKSEPTTQPEPANTDSYNQRFSKSVASFRTEMIAKQPQPKSQPPSIDMQMTRAFRQPPSPASSKSKSPKSSRSSPPAPVRRPADSSSSETTFKKLRRVNSDSDVKDRERIIQASDCIDLLCGDPSFAVPLCIDCFLARKKGETTHVAGNYCRFGRGSFLRWVVLEPRDATSKGTQRLLKIQGLVTENERMHLDDLRESYGLTDGESEHLPSLFCNNRLDMDAINYIVSCVSPVFKEAVQEEKEALAGFVSGSIKTALKCVPNGFRENCDVCETAVFDVHYVCHFCGFSVCLACKKERDARDTSRNGFRQKPDRKSFFTTEHFLSTFQDVPRDGHYWYACCSNPASPFPANDHLLATTSSPYHEEGFFNETFPHHLIPTLIVPHKALEIFVQCSEKMMQRCGKVVPQTLSPAPPTPVTPDSAQGLKVEVNDHGPNTPRELMAIVSNTPITLNGFGPQTHPWLDSLSKFYNMAGSTMSEPLVIETVPVDDFHDMANSTMLEPLVIKTEPVDDFYTMADSTMPEPLVIKTEPVDDFYDMADSTMPEPLVIETMPADEFKWDYTCVAGPGQQLLHNGGVLWFEPDNVDGPGKLSADQSDSPQALEDFRRHWKRGLPVVVSGVTDRLKRPELWLPETFKQRFGKEKVFLLDCAVKPQKLYKNFTHQSFWDGFDNFDLRKRINSKKMPLWKIKDWPTETTFSELLPEHHADLMQALPFNSYSNTTGIFNLASYLPKRCNPPDLGPKMYIAYGAAGQAKLATTNLHLDISDAVNVIVHVGVPTGNGSQKALKDAETELRKLNLDKNMRDRLAARETPGAVWQIYRPQDCDKIRSFIRSLWKERRQAAQRVNDDPIHSQSEYLDHELRQRLETEYGVIGFDILQFEGDAIFIPAGAPHQVWNIHSCIKCAEDFVSPEHVDRCVALTREFRKLPKDFENKTDKLQVKNILFHTLKSMVASMKEVDGQKAKGKKK